MENPTAATPQISLDDVVRMLGQKGCDQMYQSGVECAHRQDTEVDVRHVAAEGTEMGLSGLLYCAGFVDGRREQNDFRAAVERLLRENQIIARGALIFQNPDVPVSVK